MKQIYKAQKAIRQAMRQLRTLKLEALHQEKKLEQIEQGFDLSAKRRARF